MTLIRCAASFLFTASVLSEPAAPPITLAWPLHGSEGANGVGGWASSEVPVGAQFPFGNMRLGPDTTVGWGGGDFWWPFNHYVSFARTAAPAPHPDRAPKNAPNA